jgi:hypothetical protein
MKTTLAVVAAALILVVLVRVAIRALRGLMVHLWPH